MKNKPKDNNRIFKLTVSAMCIALCYVLPFLTAGIPQIGRMLSPMHIPVLLCGFICGPWYGITVGIVSPLLRSIIVGMPVMFPGAFAMAFELGAYGFFTGLLYRKLPKKLSYIYVTLILSMLAGRVIWGAVRVILYGLGSSSFGWKAFMAGAFTDAIPGIIAQIILVPAIVIALKKGKLIKD